MTDKITITARAQNGRPGLVTRTFRHPMTGKISQYSLGRDPVLAEAICRDLSAIANDRSLWDTQDKRLLAYEPRAVQIFFGADSAPAKSVEKLRNAINDKEAKEIRARILAGQMLTGKKKDGAIISAYMQKMFTEFSERIRRLEMEKTNQAAELEHLRAENLRLHRAGNRHVAVTLQGAIAQWKNEYVKDRARVTVQQAFRTVDLFNESQGAKQLGSIRASDIDIWQSELKSITGENLSPITRRKMRAYLSAFWTWATRRYDLSENPMSKTGTIAGVARAPENIICIRRLRDLLDLIEGLQNWPYWQAVVATAIFAGPRYSELVWIKTEDVFIGDGDYLRITSRSSGPKLIGTKTGRERSVPLEKTVLLPILAEHLAIRVKQQKHGATDAEKSPWLFPSTVPTGTVKRRITPPGLWSDNPTFARTWQKIATTAAAEQESDASYWTYGPSEWRHTFGTVLGQCGFSSLEIARLMGNSPTIAERHYIGTLGRTAGQRWPFRW